MAEALWAELDALADERDEALAVRADLAIWLAITSTDARDPSRARVWIETARPDRRTARRSRPHQRGRMEGWRYRRHRGRYRGRDDSRRRCRPRRGGCGLRDRPGFLHSGTPRRLRRATMDYPEATRWINEGLRYADSIEQSHCAHVMSATAPWCRGGRRVGARQSRWLGKQSRTTAAGVPPRRHGGHWDTSSSDEAGWTRRWPS